MEFDEKRLVKLATTLAMDMLKDWEVYRRFDSYDPITITVADVLAYCKGWIQANVEFEPEDLDE